MEGLDIRKLRVRSLSAEDLESIIEIDEKVLGERRPEYWRQKVQASTAHPAKSLVAEIEGKVVGFILGTVSGWEFGVPSSFGWVDTIGVDPDYQRKGIARTLFQRIVEEFSKEGIEKIYTLVNWEDWDLLSFFKKMGFTRGELINLEYQIRK